MKYRWWLIRENKTDNPCGFRTSTEEGWRADVVSRGDGRFDAFVCHPELNSTNEPVYSYPKAVYFYSPWEAVEWAEQFIEGMTNPEHESGESNAN